MKAVDVASEYQKRGWKLLPIVPDKKIPAVKSVIPLRERDLTIEEIEAYFNENQSNIAIITGAPSGLVVVDIDNPDIVDKYLKRYPTDLVARTPRGGMHLYFAYDGGDIGNFEGIEAGVDIRGDGGYIVASPSRIVYNDDKYKDTDLYNHAGVYEWIKQGDPAPLPPSLLRQLKRSKAPEEMPPKKEDGRSLWERVLAEGFTPGQHNRELHDCARYLFRMGMGVQAIYATMEAINSKDPTPQPEGELKGGIKSAIDYERSRLKESEGLTEPKPFTAMPIVEFLSRYWEYNVDWVIDKWLPDKSLIVIAASPGNNKTWLLLDVAVSAALGKKSQPFLGTPITNDPMPTLIVQQEDFSGLIAQRIRTLLKSKSEGAIYGFKRFNKENGNRAISFGSPFHAPIYIHTEGDLAFDNPDSLIGLERIIAEKDIKLVVIDPLYTLDPADNYFLETARHLVYFKKLRERYGTTFLITHHTRKSGGEGREQIFGSNLMNAAFEGAWVIYPENGLLVIHRSGKFFEDTTLVALDIEIDTTPGHEYYLAVATDVSEALANKNLFKGKHDKAVFEYLVDIGASGTIQGDVAKSLDISSKVARESLDRLKEMGYVTCVKRKWAVKQGFEF